jgi:hypothetical protein
VPSQSMSWITPPPVTTSRRGEVGRNAGLRPGRDRDEGGRGARRCRRVSPRND